jgi:fucose 4-O-acetylase-like acetyltransferase
MVIVLVVVVHISVTYSGIGSWFYFEGAPISPAQTIGFNFFQSMAQCFVMGLLFLIAGYFVPRSYNKKGYQKFIHDRVKRLGIPALIYLLIINPLVVYFEVGGYGGLYPDFGHYYAVGYLGNLGFLSGPGPIWFVVVLLFFSAIYAVVPKKEPKEQKEFAPTKKKIWLLVFIIAAFMFAIRLGAGDQINYYNFLLGYFGQYIPLFIVGILSWRSGLFANITYASGKRWLFFGIVIGSLSWLLLMEATGGWMGNVSTVNGGFTWQSALYCLWESAVAIALDIGLIVVFREKLNRQSKFIKTLSDNSFAVYVFHTPIIIGAALLLRPLALPPVAKFAVMVLICLPLVFLAAHFVVRKIPLLKKIM